MTNNKTLSQSEATAELHKLILSSRTLSATLEEATGEKVAEPTYETGSGGLFAAISTFEAHNTFLKSKIIVAANRPVNAAPLAGASVPVNAPAPEPKPAATEANPVHPAPVGKSATTATPTAPVFNPDAKILEVRGVKSLEELQALGPTHNSRD